MMEKVAVALERVPETLLWTLYHRAVEARRPDAVLHDPMAVELVDRIDFPFRERFGTGEDFSQWQALRARCFDDALRRFIAAHPTGTVVALGEGLETQFWRVDDGSFRWLTIDLPEVIALRQKLLPESDRLRAVGTSALDPGWMDEVDDYAGVLITAQGLLMYLEPEEVRRLPHVPELRTPRLPRGRGLVY
jgi:O-methyltransferase involved in polyketide biosynthesis